MEDKYKAFAAYLESVIDIVSQMGLKVLDIREHYIKLMMPLSKNRNHMGTMYAGSLFTLGEITGGSVFAASLDISKYHPLAKDISIRYLRPATTDITAEASVTADQIREITSALEAKGKCNVPIEFHLIDAQGEAVAFMKAIWQIRKNNK